MCAFLDSVWGAWKRRTVKGLGKNATPAHPVPRTNSGTKRRERRPRVQGSSGPLPARCTSGLGEIRARTLDPRVQVAHCREASPTWPSAIRTLARHRRRRLAGQPRCCALASPPLTKKAGGTTSTFRQLDRRRRVVSRPPSLPSDVLRPDLLSPKLREGITLVDCAVLSIVGDRVSERLSEPFGDLITTQQTDTKRARNELVRLEDAVGLEHTPRPSIMEFMNEIGELAWTNLTVSPLGKASLQIGQVETELAIMSRLHKLPQLLAELLSVSQGTA